MSRRSLLCVVSFQGQNVSLGVLVSNISRVTFKGFRIPVFFLFSVLLRGVCCSFSYPRFTCNFHGKVYIEIWVSDSESLILELLNFNLKKTQHVPTSSLW